MLRKLSIVFIIMMLALTSMVFAQNLDGRAYVPGVDPDIDMFISNWKESMPRHTHGSLIERDVLTKGNPMHPESRGAALEYVNRYTYATLPAYNKTEPTTLQGEQEIIFIVSGKGVIEAKGKTSELYKGITILVPAGLEFSMTAAGDEPLTMYLISEPIPEDFRPNDDLLIRDENTIPTDDGKGHWCHIVKYLFETPDGLGTLERILTVTINPMNIGHPHSHGSGVEEVWTGLEGTSVIFIGKQIRMQPPGTAYMIPPDGKTPHSNINASDEPIKLFYFARYGDHELRK